MTTAVKRPFERAAWLAARAGGIGGSEVAAVLGLSPWRSPVDLWIEKTGRKEPDGTVSEAMRLGNYLEEYAARRYSEESGRGVRNYGFMLVDDEAHLVADIDRLVVPEGEKIASLRSEIRTDTLLECKTSSLAWDEGVPAHYEAQVQTYLALSGCAVADFAVVFLAPRREFKTFRVARDEAVIAAIRERVKAWWARYIVGDTPPPATSEADCKALWTVSRGECVTATPSVVEAVQGLRAVNAEMDALEERADALRAAVMGAMGAADTLVDPDGRKLATWKSPKPRRTTDWKAVAAALSRTEEPVHVRAIEAAHTTETPSARRFVLCAK